MSAPLLDVADLRVSFPGRHGTVEAVRGISFQVGREKVGLVGESGSGKTMTGRACLRLIRPPGQVSATRLAFDGTDILSLSERRMRRLRGRRMSMVLQDPRYSLNPVMTIGAQIVEALRIARGLSTAQARVKALEALDAVRIRDPERAFRLHPHEVSGGMGQRIMIAMMLAPEPDLLIADEPTSALDVTVQMQVLAILDDLVTSRGMGLLFVSHDLNLVASFCDRVLVMYAGRIVESLKANELHRATHPYVRGLLDCMPALDDERRVLPTLQRDPAWASA
ncbi:ABC transporter ATP-binding protein [Zavarzinia sp. CC-PAN008]|uniref:ABC transporter ATP-binding protein n=1 Tax=Zavarzinia sp. CC-PAN008 TaxID=3243332 RepID=UPI003F749640